jgi:hypothetical protein
VHATARRVGEGAGDVKSPEDDGVSWLRSPDKARPPPLAIDTTSSARPAQLSLTKHRVQPMSCPQHAPPGVHHPKPESCPPNHLAPLGNPPGEHPHSPPPARLRACITAPAPSDLAAEASTSPSPRSPPPPHASRRASTSRPPRSPPRRASFTRPRLPHRRARGEPRRIPTFLSRHTTRSPVWRASLQRAPPRPTDPGTTEPPARPEASIPHGATD